MPMVTCKQVMLSELTHIYHCAEEAGYEITVASPKGGNVPVDPESLKPMMLDKLSRIIGMILNSGVNCSMQKV